MGLKKIKEVVAECLSENMYARNCDWRLYVDVCKKLHLPTDVSLSDIVRNTSIYPSFESVTRARRKYQERNEFKATDKVQEFRKQQELDFIKEFA